jgi:hypothetical protein
MRTVAIHQPSYLVWPPFVEKMQRADLFLYLDDAEYSKNSEINRNRVLSAAGPLWLTIPANAALGMRINEVRLPDVQWKSKHWKTICNCYARAPHFTPPLREALEEIYRTAGDRLLDVNLAFTELLREWIGIHTPAMLTSTLGVHTRSSARILDLCRAVGADRYLSGPAGLDYLDLDSFERAGIEVLVQNYQHSAYPQQFRHPEFVSRLSVLDMFFNLGSHCLPEILARGKWAPARFPRRMEVTTA